MGQILLILYSQTPLAIFMSFAHLYWHNQFIFTYSV